MQTLSRLLNTRFWLMALGTLLTLFGALGIFSGQAAASAPNYWIEPLTERELDIASVVELVWVAHMLAIGLMLFAIGLLAPDPIRARIGAIAVVAAIGSQFLAAGTASSYGYNGFSGFDVFAALIMALPIITLIACVSKWNAR